VQFPEEKSLVELLRQALKARKLGQNGDSAGSSAAWEKALAAALSRPDWLELLARMAARWDWNEKEEQTLWKLADTDSCPLWAIEYLETKAEGRADSAQLYKLSRLKLALEPANVADRNRFIALALLTGSQSGFPDQLAKNLHDENPADPDVAATYALSLCLKGRGKDAVAVLAALRPDQLRAPRVALYYGVALAEAGDSEKAAEYLHLGAAAARLPEEKALLNKANGPSRLGADL
jgi:hypothetical protein